MKNSDKLRLLQKIACLIGWRATVMIFLARILQIKFPLRVKIRKYDLQVHVRPMTDDIWVLWQVFGALEYESATRPSLGNILDLGANSGYTSLFLKHHHPASRIVALEPDPENFAALIRNVREFPGIIPIHGGVATNDGFLSSISGGNSSSKRFEKIACDNNKNDGDHSIKSYSISSLSDKYNVKSWDLIKMDIEGGELTMLQAADSWIDLTRLLAVEVHSWCAEDCERSIEALSTRAKHIFKSGETVWLSFQ